jgi:hypothetical protein
LYGINSGRSARCFCHPLFDFFLSCFFFDIGKKAKITMSGNGMRNVVILIPLSRMLSFFGFIVTALPLLSKNLKIMGADGMV